MELNLISINSLMLNVLKSSNTLSKFCNKCWKIFLSEADYLGTLCIKQLFLYCTFQGFISFSIEKIPPLSLDSIFLMTKSKFFNVRVTIFSKK